MTLAGYFGERIQNFGFPETDHAGVADGHAFHHPGTPVQHAHDENTLGKP